MSKVCHKVPSLQGFKACVKFTKKIEKINKNNASATAFVYPAWGAATLHQLINCRHVNKVPATLDSKISKIPKNYGCVSVPQLRSHISRRLKFKIQKNVDVFQYHNFDLTFPNDGNSNTRATTQRSRCAAHLPQCTIKNFHKNSNIRATQPKLGYPSNFQKFQKNPLFAAHARSCVTQQ